MVFIPTPFKRLVSSDPALDSYFEIQYYLGFKHGFLTASVVIVGGALFGALAARLLTSVKN